MATTTTNYGLKKPAPNDYYNIEDHNGNMDIIDAELKRIENEINNIDVTGTQITVDQSQAPASPGNGTLAQLFSWLANRIKAITGKSNWWEAPDTTLANAKSHIDAAAPHSGHETPAGAQAKADAAETNAKAYADNVGTAAITTANNYTDQEVTKIANNLASHKNDDTRHVSQTEKDIWNSKAEGNHNHDSRYVQTRVYNGALQYYDGGWKDVAVSPIKSIQRGTHAGGVSDDITITINTVNPAKCIVILNSSMTYQPNSTVYAPMLKNITSNSLVVSKSKMGLTNATEVPFSWQVIEYN